MELGQMFAGFVPSEARSAAETTSPQTTEKVCRYRWPGIPGRRLRLQIGPTTCATVHRVRHDLIRLFNLPQGLPWMSRLSTRLARAFSAHLRRWFAWPIASRRFATIARILTQLTFQLTDTRRQLGHLLKQHFDQFCHGFQAGIIDSFDFFPCHRYQTLSSNFCRVCMIARRHANAG